MFRPHSNDTFPILFDGDRFARAFAGAGTAAHAFIFFDNSFAVFHDDSTNRARPDAGFAADALFLINLCSHFSSS